ncbi:MAG: hypothetical protein JRI36_08985 [Deltaproteobacteria bacterium]|nr:hypothetical protein [Deltaproteobacteria bacterium]
MKLLGSPRRSISLSHQIGGSFPGPSKKGGFDKQLKNVISAGRTRQNSSKKRRLLVINEHVEENFNAVMPSAIVFQLPVNAGVDVPMIPRKKVFFTDWLIFPA